MKNQRKSFYLYLIMILVLIVGLGLIQNLIDTPRDNILDYGWQTFGTDDSELRVDLKENISWSPYKMGKPSIDAASRFVWFRVKLPDYFEDKTYIQLYLNDNSLEIYNMGEIVYSFGDVNQIGDKISYGSPFHLISIPRESEGKFLYIKMNSFFSGNSGIIRRCIIDNERKIIVQIFKSDIDNLVISIVCVLGAIVLVSTFFIIKAKVRWAMLYLALASFTTGTWMFSETGIKQLLFDNPRFWLYVAFCSFFLIPVGYLKYTEQIFADKKYSLHAGYLFGFYGFRDGCHNFCDFSRRL